MKTKEMSTKGKTIQTKQDILKQRKKFYYQVGGDDTKTDQEPDVRETERFGLKYGNVESITKKSN